MAEEDLEDATDDDDKHPCTHAGCNSPDFVSGKLS